jgi:hypothetical protein
MERIFLPAFYGRIKKCTLIKREKRHIVLKNDIICASVCKKRGVGIQMYIVAVKNKYPRPVYRVHMRTELCCRHLPHRMQTKCVPLLSMVFPVAAEHPAAHSSLRAHRL